jgi:hypothetical protein
MVQSDINLLVVGQAVMAPRMPLSAPGDLEEGVIASVGKAFVRVIFPEQNGIKCRIAATIVTMKSDLIRPR